MDTQSALYIDVGHDLIIGLYGEGKGNLCTPFAPYISLNAVTTFDAAVANLLQPLAVSSLLQRVQPRL